MAVQILMPALSPTMEEGTLAKWLVKEGDAVKSGQIIAEIETDKATMEFEAVDEGIVGKILIAEGTAGVKVNTPIAVMVEEGEAVPAASAGKVAAAPVPTVAPAASAAAPSAATPVTATAAGARVFASPLARRIAREKGVDLTSVKGSGPHGRIVKTDVEGAKPGAAAPVAAAAAASAAPAPTKPAMAAGMAAGMAAETVLKMYADRAFTEVPLDGMRRIIAGIVVFVACALSVAPASAEDIWQRFDIAREELMRADQGDRFTLAADRCTNAIEMHNSR